jgi:hypothetical protein
MRKLALILLTVSLMSVPASAHSNIKPKCPSGYDLVGTYCQDNSTEDIVLPNYVGATCEDAAAWSVAVGQTKRRWWGIDHCPPVATGAQARSPRTACISKRARALWFDLSGGAAWA